jgi:hypothetical protein
LGKIGVAIKAGQISGDREPIVIGVTGYVSRDKVGGS